MPTTQTILSWLLYAVPLVLAYAYYLRGRARRETEHRQELETSVADGLMEPPSLHPVIDPVKCIGSSTCAKVCPEGAIGIIGGKATLINGSACIGHGACKDACPFDAIKLVFGTERRGIDIPQVKPDFETNVPGIFIAGELGGMGLISKAAEQGRRAMESIARRCGDDRRGGAAAGAAVPHDVVIIGSGPAGLGAGLAAIDAKLRYLMIEQETNLGGAIFHYPRNKIAMTSPVVLPIIGRMKLDRVSKESLLDFWQAAIDKSGLQIRFNERMERVDPIDGGFVVRTSAGEHRARTVLLAIGRRGTPRKLDVPGEESAKVVYRLIDPAQYAKQRVLVVGGGDSALEAAIALAEQPGTKVTLSYRGESFNRVKQANRQRLQSLAKARRLRLAMQSTIASIRADDVLLQTQEGARRLRNDAVIVCAGGVLPTPLLRDMGVLFETKRGEA
ncbi:MAG TPA: NAD(P)-binding domain-containing protein [Burkholderiaceae bacterium]|nr:NAD(P)-binding domain-containing protein [Burkholderiaceae bacterium]